MSEGIIKARKRPLLWQSYLYWNELVEMRKRHTLRISASEREVSNLDAGFEQLLMDHLALDRLITDAKKMMMNYGESLCPGVWEWVTSIRGLGEGGLAAQLLAQIDDIALCDTISALWRFSGYGLAEYWFDARGKCVAPKAGWQWETDRKGNKARKRVVPVPESGWTLGWSIDRKLTGWQCPYNTRLKAVVWNIGDQFIKQQTPVYVDEYYAAKERAREKDPTARPFVLDLRARRKAEKLFLSHLWVVWREAEGLPVTKPYVEAILGHTHILEPACI